MEHSVTDLKCQKLMMICVGDILCILNIGGTFHQETFCICHHGHLQPQCKIVGVTQATILDNGVWEIVDDTSQ